MEREQLRIACRRHFGRSLGHVLADAIYAQSQGRFRPRTYWNSDEVDRHASQILIAAQNGHPQVVDVDGEGVLMISVKQLVRLLALVAARQVVGSENDDDAERNVTVRRAYASDDLSSR
jgi:hypothetical protein